MKLPTNLKLDTLYDLLEKSDEKIFVVHKNGANALNVVLNSLTAIYVMEYRMYTKWWRPSLVYFRVEYGKSFMHRWLEYVSETELAMAMATAAWDVLSRSAGEKKK